MNKIVKTILWGLLAAAWLYGANAWAQADPLEQGAMSVRKSRADGLWLLCPNGANQQTKNIAAPQFSLFQFHKDDYL